METVFKNLEQRVVGSYIDTFPAFIPEKCSEVTESEQKQFYNFIKNIYLKIFDNPLLLYTKLNEDDLYTHRFNKAFDNKPKLYGQMQSDTKKMEEFLNVLFEVGISGHIGTDKLIIDNSVKVNKKHLSILEQCGLSSAKENHQTAFFYDHGNEMFRAWKWMATRPGASNLSFSRCLFNSEYSYASDVFSRLLGNEKAFYALEKYLMENGYIRIDNRDNQIALDYVKNYDKKDMPVKDSWAERTHGGISLKYYYYVAKPACISLRVPKLKEILNDFDLMEDELKDFVVKRNKKCDDCRYCVQTDKMGKRNLIFTTVSLDKKYNLCPLFPGFNYCWDYMDDTLASNMMRYLEFINNNVEV